MRTIYKYELIPQLPETKLKLPRNAKFLHVEEQEFKVQTWWLVDTDEPEEIRRVLAIPTGLDITHIKLGGFLGTFTCLNKTLVFHLFELL
jgi:hypothetical protein